METIKFFLIDDEVPEYKNKNRILIKEYFNSFPNLKDEKLIELIKTQKEKELDNIIGNYMDFNLQGIEFGIKMKGKNEVKDMLDKDIIEPIKKQIPYIALSFLLLKYFELLGKKLYEKLGKDFEESYKRIEDTTSKELQKIINKVYDNIMKNNWFKIN